MDARSTANFIREAWGQPGNKDPVQQDPKQYELNIIFSAHTVWRTTTDKAVAESFFHTLKTELVYSEDYQTRDEARRSIFEYIEVFYNGARGRDLNSGSQRQTEQSRHMSNPVLIHA